MILPGDTILVDWGEDEGIWPLVACRFPPEERQATDNRIEAVWYEGGDAESYTVTRDMIVASSYCDDTATLSSFCREHGAEESGHRLLHILTSIMVRRLHDLKPGDLVEYLSEATRSDGVQVWERGRIHSRTRMLLQITSPDGKLISRNLRQIRPMTH